jgi:hypothetical protein
MVGSSGSAFAAIPPLSQERMDEIASHVIVGKVLRIYSNVDRSTPPWEVTQNVAEVRVQKVEKGEFKAPLAYVRFETRQVMKGHQPMPGDTGHYGIPKPGETTRVYVTTHEDGGLNVLAPNGFAPAKKK